MAWNEPERLNPAECDALFEELFPQGFAGQDVLADLAPEGWERSPLVAVFHPGVEQLHREAVRLHENIEALPWRREDAPRQAPPTLEEMRAEHVEGPIDAAVELAELVALCLWDVFSNNHRVLAPDGREVDLGSFRGTADFLAELLARAVRAPRSYMDVYMGTVWVHQRADLLPAYAMLFRRMKGAGLDWTYEHPRLHLVRLPYPEPGREQDNEAEPAGYDPSAAVAAEEAEREREEEHAELQRTLDEAFRESVEAARRRAPPTIVRAYESVYGRLPSGWPP